MMRLSSILHRFKTGSGHAAVNDTTSLSSKDSAAVDEYVQDFQGRPILSAFVLGAHDVGKDAVLARLYGNIFLENDFDPTAGDEYTFQMSVGGKPVELIAAVRAPAHHGPESSSKYRFHWIELRHAEACIFVYDVGDRTSFEIIQQYHTDFLRERSQDLERPCQEGCTPICKRRAWPYKGIFYVIANKTERPEREVAVSRNEGEAFAKSIGAIFVPMSARTGDGRPANFMLETTKIMLLQRVQNLAEGLEEHVYVDREQLDPWRRKNVRLWY